MNLDPKIAETIVNNLKDVINHEINLFDTTGTIIASTDPARIGTTHEGARLAIETQQPVPIDSEHQFKGAKHGINMPVMFQDTAVAVIGITGERAEVEPFGNVIKKMTEILIRENWDHVERYDRRVRVSNLAGILKLRHHDESLAAYYASMLRVDLDIPRLVLVGRAQAEDDSALDYNGLYEMFHARFESFKTSFFAFLERDICLFIDVRDERRISALVNGMSDDAKRILGLPPHLRRRTGGAFRKPLLAQLRRGLQRARVAFIRASGDAHALRRHGSGAHPLLCSARQRHAARRSRVSRPQ